MQRVSVHLSLGHADSLMFNMLGQNKIHNDTQAWNVHTLH